MLASSPSTPYHNLVVEHARPAPYTAPNKGRDGGHDETPASQHF